MIVYSREGEYKIKASFSTRFLYDTLDLSKYKHSGIAKSSSFSVVGLVQGGAYYQSESLEWELIHGRGAFSRGVNSRIYGIVAPET